MRIFARLVLSLAAAALLAPAAPAVAKTAPAARASVHPQSGLAVIPLRVKGHHFRVEVARKNSVVDTIDQRLVRVPHSPEDKRAALRQLIRSETLALDVRYARVDSGIPSKVGDGVEIKLGVAKIE